MPVTHGVAGSSPVQTAFKSVEWSQVLPQPVWGELLVGLAEILSIDDEFSLIKEILLKVDDG